MATTTSAQKSAKFIVPDKVSEKVLLFLKIPEFLYNRAVHKPRVVSVVSVSKMSSICSAVPTEHRLVTDRQTDRQTDARPHHIPHWRSVAREKIKEFPRMHYSSKSG